MRSRGSRRLRVSMTEALLAKGYDRQGRLLLSSHAGKNRVKLRGSLQMYVSRTGIDAKFVEVQRQTGLVLDKVVELCQINKKSSV